MWNSFQYIKSYIIITSTKIASVIFSIWGFISLLTPTDNLLNGIPTLFMRIIVSIVVLIGVFCLIVLGVTLYFYIKKPISIYNINSKYKLYVEYGDIFCPKIMPNNKRINIAFAANRCFDTVIDKDVISENSIHSSALKRIYKNPRRNKDTVYKEITESLGNKYKYEKITNKSKGFSNRYEAGAVAEICGPKDEIYFILGLTEIDDDSKFKARVEIKDYNNAITSLIDYIQARSQGYPTYMPIIGGGLANAGDKEDLIKYIIATIKRYKDKLNCDIHIVIKD